MSYAFPDELAQQVQRAMVAGGYQSEDDVLHAALQLLAEQQQAIAAVQEGYADVEAGRCRSFDAADAEFRLAHDVPLDQ